MKVQVTKKQIKDNYNTIIAIGYCNAQNLLKGLEANYYSAGVYGWACDYYIINNIIISTGYSPIGEDVKSDILKKYEVQAEAIRQSDYTNYNDYLKAIENVRDTFISEILRRKELRKQYIDEILK